MHTRARVYVCVGVTAPPSNNGFLSNDPPSTPRNPLPQSGRNSLVLAEILRWMGPTPFPHSTPLFIDPPGTCNHHFRLSSVFRSARRRRHIFQVLRLAFSSLYQISPANGPQRVRRGVEWWEGSSLCGHQCGPQIRTDVLSPSARGYD
jgi:hypothetical protein